MNFSEMDPNLWNICKSFLTFSDLCASRRVSKSWMDIRSVPFPHRVYFWDDGSNVNLPDSHDINFRKCLMAATLTKFHCQIFNEEQFKFVLGIIHSVKDIIFEFDGGDMSESPSFHWNPYLLSAAPNLVRLELCVSNIKNWIFKIDFSVFKNLIHIESDVLIRYENYDGRTMKCIALQNYNWVPELNEIMPNTEHAKMQSSPGDKVTKAQNELMPSWTTDMTMNPTYLSMVKHGLVYFYLRKGYPPYLTLCPIFSITGTNSVAFIAEYRHVYGRAMLFFPNIKFEFLPSCDQFSRKTWVKIINGARESQRMSKPLLKVEDIPDTPLDILNLNQVRDDDLYSSLI